MSTEKKHPISKEQIEKLKEKSPVGKWIKFYYTFSGLDQTCLEKKSYEKLVVISGVIENVYEHTFRLGGKIYQWVDYAIGYIY